MFSVLQRFSPKNLLWMHHKYASFTTRLTSKITFICESIHDAVYPLISMIARILENVG